MNRQTIITILIVLVAFVACRPSVQKATAEMPQSSDSTEAVTTVDTQSAFSTTAASVTTATFKSDTTGAIVRH